MKNFFSIIPMAAAAMLMTQCKPAATAPAEDPDEYTGYLFAYFTGNAVEEEQVCYAVSGDSLDFHALNGGMPVIASERSGLKPRNGPSEIRRPREVDFVDHQHPGKIRRTGRTETSMGSAGDFRP